MIHRSLPLAVAASAICLIADGAAQNEVAAVPGARSLNASWATTFGGTNADRVAAATRAPSDCFYVGGPTFSFGGIEQVWVACLTSVGNALWEQALTAAGSASFGAMTGAADGGLLVVGQARSGPDAAGWIVKLSVGGTVEWSRTYDDVGDDSFTAVSRSPNGYYVAGQVAQPNSFFSDVCVMEIDDAGNPLWQKRVDGDLQDVVKALTATRNGLLVSVDSQSSFPGRPSIPAAAFFRPWMLRFDGSGNVLWQRLYDFSSGDAINDVAALEDGGFVAVGEVGAMGFFRGDVWVIRIDAAGDVLWHRGYGDIDANYYDGAFDVQPTRRGTFAIAASTSTAGAGSDDLWLLEVADDGELLWSFTAGGTGFDGGTAIAPFGNGEYLVGGFYQAISPQPSEALVMRFDPRQARPNNCVATAPADPNQWTPTLQVDAPQTTPTDMQFTVAPAAVQATRLDTGTALCQR